jgi:hypothetical protein
VSNDRDSLTESQASPPEPSSPVVPDPRPDAPAPVSGALFDGESNADDFVFSFEQPSEAPPEQPFTVLDAPPVDPLTQAPPPAVVPPLAQPAQVAAQRPPRRRVKLQARKVRRIVRHIEPWSVLKISLIFYFCLWIIFVLAGVLLWSVAVSSGIVGKVENFVIELFALETFAFDASAIFRGYAFGGLVMVVAGTAFNVLLCVLFNLISDLTGGLRITVIEEESARFRPPRNPARAVAPAAVMPTQGFASGQTSLGAPSVPPVPPPQAQAPPKTG